MKSLAKPGIDTCHNWVAKKEIMNTNTIVGVICKVESSIQLVRVCQHPVREELGCLGGVNMQFCPFFPKKKLHDIKKIWSFGSGDQIEGVPWICHSFVTCLD